jgi:hypothetical protein
MCLKTLQLRTAFLTIKSIQFVKPACDLLEIRTKIMNSFVQSRFCAKPMVILALWFKVQ